MSIASDLIRGHTDTIILAQLLQEDSYGYKKLLYIPHSGGSKKPVTSVLTGEMKIPVPEDVIIPLHRKAATPTGSYAANRRLQRDLLTF